MAELLVRIIGKVSQDEKKDAALSKRGHVISARPDGHAWTDRELKNPEWMIVRAPKLTLVEAEQFLAAGPTSTFSDKSAPNDRSRDVAVRQKRQFSLDIDALPKIKANRDALINSTMEL